MDEFPEEMGELRARVVALEARLGEAEEYVDEIRQLIARGRGVAWVLAGLGGFAGWLIHEWDRIAAFFVRSVRGGL